MTKQVTYPIAPLGLATSFTESETPANFATKFRNRFINAAGGAEKRQGMTQTGSIVPGTPTLNGIHELVLPDGGEVLLVSGDGKIAKLANSGSLDSDGNSCFDGLGTAEDAYIMGGAVSGLTTGAMTHIDDETFLRSGVVSGDVTGSFKGGADSNKFTVSFWFKYEEFATLSGSTGFLQALKDSPGEISVLQIFMGEGLGNARNVSFQGKDSSNTLLFTITVNIPNLLVVHHLVFSVDLSDSSKTQAYVDDVPTFTTASTFVSGDIGFSVIDEAYLGAFFSGVKLWQGDVGDFWLAHGEYIDLSVEENRRKFISAEKTPVDMGPNGEYPTCSTPTVFLSGSLAKWNVNKGSAGGFTVDRTTLLTFGADALSRGADPLDPTPNGQFVQVFEGPVDVDVGKLDW